jgi:hypothetical protein
MPEVSFCMRSWVRCLLIVVFFSGGIFLVLHIQHCFISRPSNSTVSMDAGIEPSSVATLHWQSGALTTRLDLIHTRLDLIHTRLDLIHSRLDLIHTWLDLILTRIDLIASRLGLIYTRLAVIHNSARSHRHSARSHRYHPHSARSHLITYQL